MLESRSDDALAKLVKTVETVETVETVYTVESEKSMSYWLTYLLTTWKQEMLAHLKIFSLLIFVQFILIASFWVIYKFSAEAGECRNESYIYYGQTWIRLHLPKLDLQRKPYVGRDNFIHLEMPRLGTAETFINVKFTFMIVIKLTSIFLKCTNNFYMSGAVHKL